MKLSIFLILLLGVCVNAIPLNETESKNPSSTTSSSYSTSSSSSSTTPSSSSSTTVSSDISTGSSTTAKTGNGVSELKAKDGEGEGIKTKAFCTREYRPICASNGQTFNNKCEFENAQLLDSGLNMTHDGAC